MDKNTTLLKISEEFCALWNTVLKIGILLFSGNAQCTLLSVMDNICACIYNCWSFIIYDNNIA